MRCDVRELKTLRKPCILHWRFNHFVVLKSVSTKGIVAHDPARGVVKESIDSTANAFTGIALEVFAAQKFRQSGAPRRLSLIDLMSRDTSMVRKFAAGLLLALICEVLLLATPFYLQVVIDQVLAIQR